MQSEAVASEVRGCKMTYLDAYLAIGIVCMFWFIFVEIRDGSDLGDNQIAATIIALGVILALGVIVFYPIWLIHRLAIWDRKNIKDKE